MDALGEDEFGGGGLLGERFGSGGGCCCNPESAVRFRGIEATELRSECLRLSFAGVGESLKLDISPGEAWSVWSGNIGDMGWNVGRAGTSDCSVL